MLGGFSHIYGATYYVYSVPIRNRNIAVAVARRAFDGGVCANAPPSPGERLGYRPPAPRGESPYAQHTSAPVRPPGPRANRARNGRPAFPPDRRPFQRPADPPDRRTRARALNFRRNPVPRVRVFTTQYFPSPLQHNNLFENFTLPPPRFCPSPRNHGHGRAWTRSGRRRRRHFFRIFEHCCLPHAKRCRTRPYFGH